MFHRLPTFRLISRSQITGLGIHQQRITSGHCLEESRRRASAEIVESVGRDRSAACRTAQPGSARATVVGHDPRQRSLHSAPGQEIRSVPVHQHEQRAAGHSRLLRLEVLEERSAPRNLSGGRDIHRTQRCLVDTRDDPRHRPGVSLLDRTVWRRQISFSPSFARRHKVRNTSDPPAISCCQMQLFSFVNAFSCFLSDCRGRSPEWYTKHYGHICALHIARIRDSFSHVADGPESKV